MTTTENRVGDLMSPDKTPAQHIHPQPVQATPPPAKSATIQEAAYIPNQPRFTIRCQKCRWAVVNGGTSPELKSLHEIPNNCPTCGKARQFRCPKCGRPAKMSRVKGA